MKHKFDLDQKVVYTGETNNYTYSFQVVKGCTGIVEKIMQAENKTQYSVKLENEILLTFYEEDLST